MTLQLDAGCLFHWHCTTGCLFHWHCITGYILHRHCAIGCLLTLNRYCSSSTAGCRYLCYWHYTTGWDALPLILCYYMLEPLNHWMPIPTNHWMPLPLKHWMTLPLILYYWMSCPFADTSTAHRSYFTLLGYINLNDCITEHDLLQAGQPWQAGWKHHAPMVEWHHDSTSSWLGSSCHTRAASVRFTAGACSPTMKLS